MNVDMFWKIPLIALVGYLLGNFQTGALVARKAADLDIRQTGSKSTGTTNVLRTLGWLPSALTLLGDVLKGLLGGLFGLWLMGATGARLGGLAAIVGHNWPALFGFKGGKGIATSLGAILALDPLSGLCLVVCQALVVYLTHTMSLASMASAIFYFLLTLIRYLNDPEQIVFAAIVAALALFTHRGNIKRLFQGGDNKLDFQKIREISKERKKKTEGR